MAVFRVERTQGYTVMSNYHLRDKSLSLKAKGLLSQMLSLPEDWDYTLSGLAVINRESKDAIRSAVNELEKAGYIKRRQTTDAGGKFSANEYVIYERPVAHIIGREYLLDIKTGVQLVSSKAGKILCDDDGDVAVAHVIHHLFKGWAIEIRAGIAIVHIKSGVLEPILIGVLLQDKFLRRDLSRVFSS